MDFGLTDDQREIQRTARDLLEQYAAPARVRGHAEAASFDSELWGVLCNLGWPGIALAEEVGGQGLGTVELTVLCEELGRAVAPVPFMPSVLAATIIDDGASAAQRERWLPGLASGELVGAVGHASGGRAELVPGASDADVIVLLEKDQVRLLAAGQTVVEPILSIDPTVPAAAVTAQGDVGELLDGDCSRGLARASVALAAELVGICHRALEMTVAYVKERRQFGTPVGAYQAVSHGCTRMLLETEKARVTTSYAAWAADAEPTLLPQAAAMAKATASDAARDVTGAAIQLHGGIGFTWEADVHWLYKRAHVDAALLGGGWDQRAQLMREIQAARA
jgi:alkylation response protein AidB-like acyl-CoA dehydrogenase